MTESSVYLFVRRIYRMTLKPLKKYITDTLELYCMRKVYRRVHNQDKSKIINAVYILQYPEMFNSFKSVYYSMLNDEKFNVSLVCVPKMNNEYKGILSDENDALAFCEENGLKAINGYKNGIVFDLATLSPDYLILMRSYDSCMPEEYSMKNLQKIALIAYIPYSGRTTKGIHIYYEFRNLLNRFNLLFADCVEVVNWIQEHRQNKRLEKYQKIFNIGYPRFDLIDRKEQKTKSYHTVLWIARWSLEESHFRSRFFDYLECILNYFSVHTDLNLIIRPHPRMFTEFITTGYKTEAEIKELKSRIDKIENVKFDNNTDYLKTFDESDVLIADSSSLLLEYFFTLKPVAVSGIDKDLTDFGEKMLTTFTVFDSERKLIDFLEKISAGIDDNYEKRMLLYNCVKFNNNKQIGYSIKEAIKKDFTGE